MSFLKFKGKKIFTGSGWLDEQQVLVTDATGIVQEWVALEEAGPDVQEWDGIICPGFVNAHCHLELSHLKNRIAPGSGMVPFLLQVMGRRAASREQIREAMQAATGEMIQNGIVAVGDICNTADSLPEKQAQQLYYHNFIEVSGFVPATAALRLEAARKVYAQFRSAFPAAQVSITPHAPYSVSPELFRLIGALPGNNLLTLHNQESEAENLFFRWKEGAFLQLFETIGVNLDFYQPPVQNSLPAVCGEMGMAQKQWLLVHNCLTTAADLEKSCLPLPGVFFCLCPGANQYIGNPLPDVRMLQQYGLSICIGTDSLASNGQLSILAELQCLQQHFPELPLTDLLQWATLNGARALQVADHFGSFEKGKKPGVLLLEQAENGLTEQTTVKRLV